MGKYMYDETNWVIGKMVAPWEEVDDGCWDNC